MRAIYIVALLITVSVAVAEASSKCSGIACKQALANLKTAEEKQLCENRCAGQACVKSSLSCHIKLIAFKKCANMLGDEANLTMTSVILQCKASLIQVDYVNCFNDCSTKKSAASLKKKEINVFERKHSDSYLNHRQPQFYAQTYAASGTNGTAGTNGTSGTNSTSSSPPPTNGTTNGTSASPPPPSTNGTTNGTSASPPPPATNGTSPTPVPPKNTTSPAPASPTPVGKNAIILSAFSAFFALAILL